MVKIPGLWEGIKPHTSRFRSLAAGLLWLLLTGFLHPQGQTIPVDIWREAGVPHIQNFSTRDYGENPQNWCIVQDNRGIMYIGNTHGVLEYDGISWRLIRIANNYVVRSLAIHNGTIYVGGQNELGYLAPDSAGQLEYVSLLHKVPQKFWEFKDVWKTLIIGDAIYFRTSLYLFRLKNERFDVWPWKTTVANTFAIDQVLYAHQTDVGLMQLSGDSLQIAPGGEFFRDKRISVMLPFDNGRILIGTRRSGLFLYDGASVSSFFTPADAYLRMNNLYFGKILANELIAFATLNGGVIIIDKKGQICQVLNKSAGLRDERVYHIFSDRQGSIWLALNNGLARVETPDPLSYFPIGSGFEGIVESLIRHRGTLYAGTHRGLYYLDKSRWTAGETLNTNRRNASSETGKENAFPTFKPVEGISFFVWDLAEAGDHLLAAAGDGIYSIKDSRAELIKTEWPGARSIVCSNTDPNRVYVGLEDGLGALQYKNGIWTSLGRFPGISERMFDIAQDLNGDLWLGTQYDGVIKVELSSASPWSQSRQFEGKTIRYGKAHRLPDNQISVSIVAGQPRFATQKGLMKFDTQQQIFLPDSTFGALFADSSTAMFRIAEDTKENVWILAIRDKTSIQGVAMKQPDGTYFWQNIPFVRLKAIGDIFRIYPENNGVVWFGGTEGIARYTPDIPGKYTLDYPTVIRRVAGISYDSVYYYGAASRESYHPVFKNKHNSLRFEFAALSFDDVSANRYQFMLEGLDEDWSKWTDETKKDYTHLPAGDFVFKVRGKDVYNHISNEARYEFTVLPPWYQSPWLYLVYALLGGGLIFGIVKYRVRQLERKSRELETIVAERTAEVVEQRNQLKEQSEKLKEMDELKSRFFANISHEFRTPLTLILGLLDKTMRESASETDRIDYEVMRRNANRLLQLINQLLELSKLEAGGTKLQASRGNIVLYLRRILVSFASLGEQKNIRLTFNGAPVTGESGHAAIIAYFDPDKLERVFYNLLSNAFKFTPQGGFIEMTVGVGSTDSSHSESGPVAQFVEIRLANTGPGIAADKLSYIFDRFYQADDTTTRQYEGTGIGLALVKELVELHHGQISAESVEGEKTVFTIKLPLGRAHLTDEEIAPEEAREGAKDEIKPVEITGSISANDPVSMENVENSRETRTGVPEKPVSAEDEIRVLIVEDHLDLREFIRAHLAPDYTVLEAENGVVGLQQAEEGIPDLIISDIMMPEMDGYALCKAVKTNEKTSHIPIILLTAKAATEDKLEGLETGADDYLIKPFNPEELKIRVRNLIRLRQQMREKFSAEMLLKPSDVVVPSAQKVFLERLTTVIEEHLDDENFSVEVLGREIGMSRAQIHRKLRALTNQSATEFIRSFRLQRAAELIKQDAGNMAEIAYMVGFNSQAYFTRCFQEEFGCSPREYRARHQHSKQA